MASASSSDQPPRNDNCLLTAYNLSQESLRRNQPPRVPSQNDVGVDRYGGTQVNERLIGNRGLRAALMVSLTAASLMLITGSVASAADVKAVAAGVDAHYNHLRSLEATFTEIYKGSGMDRTESGTLWLKKPGKMRWEYRSPREKLFVSNGKDAWFYVPDDRQARKESAKKLEDVRSPLAFLLGKAKLEKELRGLSVAPDIQPTEPGNLVLRGVPTALADEISEIVLEVTPESRIVRLIVQGVDGASTEYRFSEQKEDVAIADGRFNFKAPAGTEIVDEAGMGQ